MSETVQEYFAENAIDATQVEQSTVSQPASSQPASQQIIINDKVYSLDELSNNSRRYVEHMIDIETKMNKCVFEMEQLTMTRDFLNTLLEASLKSDSAQSDSAQSDSAQSDSAQAA